MKDESNFTTNYSAVLYKTGDLARYRPDGNIEFLGRLDDQVKIRGFRIEPGEIETVLKTHAAVQTCCVVVRQDLSGKSLIAYWVLNGEQEEPQPGTLRTYLSQTLPDYMVPKAFVQLEALPLTPNGKIDRRALPAPELQAEADYVPPRTEAEKILVSIWGQVLGIKQIGIHDNFFEMGGDSILSLQIISQARLQGLHLTPQQVFQHQTIAGLASVATTTSPIQAEQGLVLGAVPLTPVQHWFFEQKQPEPHHFNQAVLLKVPATATPAYLEQAVKHLLIHHDALRLRFELGEADWHSTIIHPGEQIPFSVSELSHLSPAEQEAAIEARAADLQASLNLSDGPLLRVVLFKLDPAADEARLLIIIHHLVVDGVSWRILLEDMEIAYQQISRAQAVQLPPKSTSFKYWAERLAQYQALEEVAYWSTRSNGAAALPTDHSLTGNNTVNSAATVSVSLSREQTEALLRQVPPVYHTQVNDLLLAALALSLAEWTESNTLLIDLEGHGREEIFDNVDLSRTVGWFTTIFPVQLQLDSHNPAQVIRSIKEQLRQIPQRGIGYGLLRYLAGVPELQETPPTEVSFNYLGQFDLLQPAETRLITHHPGAMGHRPGGLGALNSGDTLMTGLASEESGPLHSPLGRRGHLLEVNSLVVDGRLQVEWSYSKNIHHAATIERLATCFIRALQTLIDHCLLPGAGGYTPSDFPEAGLTQPELDSLLAALKALSGQDRTPHINLEAIYPVSPTQQGMIFHTLYAPNSGAYVTQLSYEVPRTLNRAAFQQAWQQVVDRHPVLRTLFVREHGHQPLQVVCQHAELPWVNLDWRDEPEPEQQLDAFLAADRSRGFELDRAPLMRCTLIRLSETTYQFVWTHHHLLIDGWSMPLIFQDVFAFYKAIVQGKQMPLSPPRPYRDYIALLQKQDREQAKIFWQQKLQGFTTPSPLVVDRNPLEGPAETANGQPYDEFIFNLPAEATAGLQALARQNRLTLNTLVQGAWAILLSRYSGEADVLFGTTISGRPPELTGIESMVGLFINALPVRVQVWPETPVLPWLIELQNAQVQREQYWYSLLVDIQGWSDVPRGRLLFESLVVFENYPIDDALLRSQDIQVSSIRSFEQTHYPLTLFLAISGQRLSVRLNYDTSRFEKDTISRMVGHFQTLLTGFVTNRDTLEQVQIRALPILPETEKHKLLVEWNDTRVDYSPSQNRCIHQVFEQQVAQTPGAVAVWFNDHCLTYRELNQKSNQLAYHLISLGVEPGTVVGIYTEPSLEMMIGLLGILKAGGAYVPLDPSYPVERLNFILKDSQASILLTQQHLSGTLSGHRAKEVLLDAPRSTLEPFPTENPAVDISAAQPAYVIYTSGSTGPPKGVIGLHRGAINRFQWMWHTYPFAAGEICCQKTTLSFVDSIWEIFGPLLQGVPTVIMPQSVAKDPHQLVQALAERHVTRIVVVPSLLQAMLTTYPDLQERLRHLKYWTCSGEPLTPELARQFQRQLPNGILLNLYGSSEVAADVTWYDTQGQALSSTVPIGRPIANMQTYILDKQLEPVPIGVPGEIYVSGVGLAQGYINRPDLTAERFIPNPFNTSDESNVAINYSSFLYKTGDLARYRPDGNIEYLGRTDNQVKIRGFRVELGEIEAILNEHPDIQAGVVAANQEQAMLAAYLVPAQAKLAVDDIRVYLSKKLPSYMVPTAFVELASLPLTPNGKIDRRALPLPEKTRLTLSTPFTAPQTPTEMLLANIWRDVLGLEQVGIHDNFFELGGHSLLATQIISRVRDTFSSFMPLHHLFETPTVAGLALVLDNADIQTPLPPIRPMPRTADTELPLSFAQQRLWFLAQLEGPGAAYNIPLAVRISGTLNLTALEQSISKIIERHEVLRTTFHTENGRPYQVIAPSLNLMIPLVDAQASSPQDDEIQRLMLAEAEKPFDLETGPLLRVTVLRLEPQTHVLLVTMHHIISDGWSIGVLVRELSALYQAYVTDTTHPLPDLPIQYADFAGWQRQWLAGEVLETQLNYWKEQLADIPPLLELPTDHPRPAIQSYRGASHAFVLPQSLSAALNALSLKTGTTLFMTLQAAFATLLFRYSGQNDILMGTPVANRNHTEIEPLIGFFVNILVLRTSFEENPTFLTLLNQVRQVSLEAYHHQDLPFELLVDALQPERNLGHTPLFQVLFVLQNVPLEKVELPELTLTPLVSDTTTAKFDLTLMIEEREAGLSGHFEYNTDLFEAATIERMVRHFQTLLAGIVANPNRSVSTLPLLTPAERQQLLTAWGRAITAPQIAAARSVEKAEEFDRTGGTATSSENRPHSPVRHSKIRLFSEKINRSLHELFEAQVDCTPDAPAVSFNGQTLTYQELNLRANRLAHHLIWLGVGPDVLVGLYVERSPELIIGLLAILKAGGAYVPLDPTYPAERLAFMVADAQLPLIITQTPLRNTLQPVLQPEQETQLLCLDTDWKATDPTHAQNPAHTTTAENLAYVIYTSGSTGQPKGVLVTHANVTRLFEATHGWFNFDENDVWTFFHSIAFDFSVWEIWGALLYGGRLVVVPYLTSRSPQEFYQLLGQERVTVLNQTPSAFRQLIQAEASIAATSPEESATLALRLVIFGGEALEPAMLKPWFERHGPTCQLVNMYGITETTVHVTYRPLSPADTQRAGSPIGGPIPDLQLYILDPHLEPVPLGIPGELYVGGAGVSRGYLHCPALTEERFIDNPFGPGRLYKTGDLARYVASGDIEYLGRNDRQVKIRGFRIELGEIATVLNQHQAISEAVVIAGDDPTGPQLVAHQLVAYIVPQTSSDQPAPDLVSEVRAYLSKRLPTYMVPAAIMPLPALPLTPNGKVDYRALPAPEISSTIAFVPPRNPTEETIAAIWRDVLSVDQVGIHDNFFEMGGHSLLAVRLMGHIQQEFEMNFPLAALFQNPTIEQLAILLRRQIDSNSWDCLVPIQPKGDLSPFFWMPGVGGNVIYFYELAQHLNMALAETNNLRPFYGLQAVGLDGESEPYTTVEAMAAHYIESIKTVQPQGPYLLGGHSFGGYVAFEMAQQLMRAGQDVALLAILDAPAPLPNRSKQTLDWDDTRWLMEMIGVVEHMTGINLSISYQTLQSLSAEEQITYIHEQLQMSQLFPSGNDVTLVRGLLQVLKTNSQIHYVPQGILPTQITLFRTGAEDTLWGWDALGAVELYHVPGDHFTMLAEPHVQVLAKQLVALIEGLVDKKAL
jgi:amino acid adenylation domain-containing protein/non-ribosomal peptide synthase protein (TIGR01720 family)